MHQVTQQNRIKNTLYTFPIFAILLFTVTIVTIYNIYGALNSSAVSTGSHVFNLNAENSLGVRVAESTVLDIQPTSGGAFNSTPLTVYVETDNEYGYTLTMATTTPNLKRTTSLSDGTIPTIETLASGSSFTTETFTTNRWGYTTDNTNYYAIPGSVIINPNGTRGNYDDNPNIITFAAKLDNETPSGNYLTTINFIATAKTPTDLSGFDAAFIFAGAEKLTHGGESYYAMQDLTHSVCSYVATPSSTNITSYPTVTVFDSRDYEKYLIGKLADGSCWLLDNLRLGGDSPIALTPADTNIMSNWTLPASTTTCFTESANCDNSGDSTHTGYTIAAINASKKNTANDSGWKYGNYYNYCAATAGQYCTTISDAENLDPVASYDLCPANWKLPQYLNSGSTHYLYSQYGDQFESFRTVLRTPYSSAFVNGSLRDTNSENAFGIFWNNRASTNNVAYAHNTLITISGASTLNAYYRYEGYSIRCVSRQTISDLTYMQDFATLSDSDKTDVLNSMLPETTYTLLDKRDNQAYTIAKLKDNKVWMTKNLNLAGGTALYSDTSDVPMGYPSSASTPYYTLPESSTTGFDTHLAAFVYNSNETDCSSINGCYSYYSWMAATLDAKDASGNAIADDANAPYSICPAGWRLPTTSQNNPDSTTDYRALIVALGGNAQNFFYNNTSAIASSVLVNKLTSEPYNFNSTGFYSSEGKISSNGFAYYTTATNYNSINRLGLGFAATGSAISAADTNAKSAGMAVRCLLK